MIFSVLWSLSENVYLRRTLRVKSTNVEWRFCVGSGRCGINLWPSPRSCLVPIGGECCVQRLWKVRLVIALKYWEVGVRCSMMALFAQCV